MLFLQQLHNQHSGRNEISAIFNTKKIVFLSISNMCIDFLGSTFWVHPNPVFLTKLFAIQFFSGLLPHQLSEFSTTLLFDQKHKVLLVFPSVHSLFIL